MKSNVKSKVKRLAKLTPTINFAGEIRRLKEQNKSLKKDRGILQLEKGQLEADVRGLKQIVDEARTYLAKRYIKGSGIEIGATYLPVKVPKKANVKYLDEATLEELYKRYPELKKLDMAPIDIVDNAEKLTTIKDGSLDFIIANHFMEHTIDPIGTLITFQSKLRKDGVIFLAIPDKRYTFDIKRDLTSYDHLVKEHTAPTKQMKYQHFLEAAEFLDHIKEKDKIVKRANELMDMKYSIHYHVWTRATLVEFFEKTIEKYSLPLEIVVVLENNPESIFILKKTANR